MGRKLQIAAYIYVGFDWDIHVLLFVLILTVPERRIYFPHNVACVIFDISSTFHDHQLDILKNQC